METLIIIPLACLLNIAVIPIIIKLSIKNKWFDVVSERKIHKGNIPRLGGIGITWSSLFLILLSSFVSQANNIYYLSTKKIILLLSMLIIHIISLIDDFKGLPARFRFCTQCIISLGLSFAGYRFYSIWFPIIGTVSLPLWLSYAITSFWVVGIINALNMIDGMDGLCGGISSIIMFIYGIISLSQGQIFSAAISFSFFGSLLGFLIYNFPPAKIFMGDSGSTVLGFLIAYLPLISISGKKIDLSFYIGISMVLIPIYDTFAAIFRRTKAGVSIMSPDRWHLHHKLLALGFETREILVIIYSGCILLGEGCLFSLYIPKYLSFILNLSEWVVFLCLFLFLHYLKRKKLTSLS